MKNFTTCLLLLILSACSSYKGSDSNKGSRVIASTESPNVILSSIRYTKILNDTAKNMDELSYDLDRDGNFVKVANPLLSAVFMIEVGFATWTYLGSVAISGEAVTGATAVMTDLMTFFFRPLITGNATLVAGKFLAENSGVFKGVEQKLDKMKQADPSAIDRNFRKNPELFLDLSEARKAEYRGRLLNTLQSFPKVFNKFMLEVDKNINEITNKYDPANTSYLKRISKLGSDQILYGQVVAAGINTRASFYRSAAQTIDNLTKEYNVVKEY